MKTDEIKLLGYYVWAAHVEPKAGWFRLFGRGLSWKHISLSLMFSERYGYRKYCKLGSWVIKIIKP